MLFKIKTYFSTLAGLLLTLLILILIGVVPLNLFFAKSPLAQVLQDQTGLQFEIGGVVRLRLGSNASLTMEKIGIGSVSEDPHSASIAILDIRFSLRDLINRRWRLVELTATDVNFDRCFDWSVGTRNLQESSLQTGPPIQPPTQSGVDSSGVGNYEVNPIPGIAVDRYRIVGESYCSDQSTAAPATAFQVAGQAAVGQPMELEASVSLDEGVAGLKFRGSSLAELLADANDYPIDGTLTFGEQFLELSGRLQRPISNLAIEADLRGTIFEHNFTATLEAEGIQNRPIIDLNLQVPRLTIDGSGAETRGFDQWQDLPLSDWTAWLNRIDGTVDLRISEFVGIPVRLRDLHVPAQIKSGELNINGASLQSGNSRLQMSLGLSESAQGLELEGVLDLVDFDLTNSFSEESARHWGGLLQSAEVSAQSSGHTPQQHLDSMSAHMTLQNLTLTLDDGFLPLSIDNASARIGQEEPFAGSLEANWQGKELMMDWSLGTPRQLLAGTPWPATISVSTSESQLDVQGIINPDSTNSELNGKVRLESRRIGDLHPFLRVDPEQATNLVLSTDFLLESDSLVLDDLFMDLGDSDIKGQVLVPLNQTELPIRLNLESNQLDLTELYEISDLEEQEKPNLEPVSDQSPFGFMQGVEFPRADIDLSVGRLEGTGYELTDLALKAQMERQRISGADLQLRFEGVRAKGTLDADFAETDMSLHTSLNLQDLNIGRLLRRMDWANGIEASAQNVQASLSGGGESIEELVDDLELTATVNELNWHWNRGADNRPWELQLPELELALRRGEDVVWTTAGILNGQNLRAAMRTPSLKSVFNTRRDLPVTLVVGSETETTRISANVSRQPGGLSVLDLNISGSYDESVEEFSNPVEMINFDEPLQGYKLSGRVKLGSRHIEIENFEAKIKQSLITGQVQVRPLREGHHFDVSLHSPFLETDDLLGWVADIRRGLRQESEHDPAKDAFVGASLDEQDGGLMMLATQRLKDLVEYHSADLSIQIEDLNSAGAKLGRASTRLQIDGDQFRLDPMTIQRGSLGVDARYVVETVADGLDAEMELQIEQLPYGGILRLFDEQSKAKGTLYTDVSLFASAPSPDELLQNIIGNVDVLLIPEDVRANLLDIWGSNLIIALLPSGPRGKVMNCMVNRFTVENGVMTTRNSFLDSTNIIVRARGDIDLVRRELDLLIAPQAKTERFLSISTPLAVTGPFDKFRVRPATGGLFTTMLRFYYGLIYVPWKWLTGERFPRDGISTCFNAMDWEMK